MDKNIIIIFCFLFSILIIIFIRVWYEQHIILFKNIKIKIDKISEPYKFLFLSDLHNEKIDNVLNKIKKYGNVDLYISGDLIICDKKANIFINNILSFIKKIRENTKINNIYFGLGNHELRLIEFSKNNNFAFDKKNELYDIFNKYNVKILDDCSLNVNKNIVVYGISLYKGFYKKEISFHNKSNLLTTEEIKKRIGALNNTKINIVLSHNPDYSENLINYGFDIVLSGHHHGGLIRLPFIGAIFSSEFMILPKYTKGLYKYNNKYIIVNSGIGGHTVKLRLNNTKQIYFVEINGE